MRITAPGLRRRLTGLGLVILAIGGATGCESQARLAEQLRSAATPPQMPAVVACWERAFEQAGFRGRYLATVDFRIAEDGQLEEVAVVSLVDLDAGGQESKTDEADDFRRCLSDALAETRLPGIDLGRPLSVEGYRIAFDDASRQARREASERAPHVLVGPRANRCRGLYVHEPPRELTVLQAELDEATGEARQARGRDRDRLARALQKQFDVALELIERLRIEALDPDLSRQARARYETEIANARDQAATAAASIGCELPPTTDDLP